MDGNAVRPFLPDLHTKTVAVREDEHAHREDTTQKELLKQLRERRKKILSPKE